jgi:hypothetical protein
LFSKRSWRTLVLDTRMFVTKGHQLVRSFHFEQLKASNVLLRSISNNYVRKGHHRLARTCHDFGMRAKHTSLVHIFQFEETNYRTKFQGLMLVPAFLRPKSCSVSLPLPYFRAEDNQPLGNKQNPKVCFCLGRIHPTELFLFLSCFFFVMEKVHIINACL